MWKHTHDNVLNSQKTNLSISEMAGKECFPNSVSRMCKNLESALCVLSLLKKLTMLSFEVLCNHWNGARAQRSCQNPKCHCKCQIICKSKCNDVLQCSVGKLLFCGKSQNQAVEESHKFHSGWNTNTSPFWWNAQMKIWHLNVPGLGNQLSGVDHFVACKIANVCPIQLFCQAFLPGKMEGNLSNAQIHFVQHHHRT